MLWHHKDHDHPVAPEHPENPEQRGIRWASATPPIEEHGHAAPNDMLSGLLLEDAVLYNATRKVMNPPDKQLFLGLLAGIWVGLGGLTAISLAGGVPEDVRARWLSLPKFLNGAWFAFALHFIAMFGGELFTGNTMILSIGVYNRFVAAKSVLLNLILVYIGNWLGCLLVAYFLGYLTDIFHDPQYTSYMDSIVLVKLEQLTWVQIFLRAIPANLMVCMAFMLGIAARGAAGKIMALWFPVVMFVICGFEHCVANMFFTSIGLMYGAPSSIGRLFFNQSAAMLGNLVGGAIFVGLAAHLMNHWKSPFFTLNNRGTLLGHDGESTRRAREVQTMEEGRLVRVASNRVQLDRRGSLSYAAESPTPASQVEPSKP